MKSFSYAFKMRGGSRGRAARGGRSGLYKPKVFIPRVPFDVYVCESFFPRVKLAPDDNTLTQAILKESRSDIYCTRTNSSIESCYKNSNCFG
ncbi:interleukin enhancer-binding factor 2-like protein [Caerostris extrusa]|uniref:Interleukin enhancer-binding factor 2-like protein n=1 Tax=Caerostris extrusa TaxID=172846 RepID=A0AAV4R3R5_CAEEX|nr:interleukin enhancer-binding factor 2-like protein [Caerostris extrusa]